MRLLRRQFLARLVAFPPFVALRRRAAAQAAAALDRTALLAIAEVVLPSELGVSAVAALVDGFERWLRGYRPDAELLHGYGTATLRRTPPSPAPRWVAQLRALDEESRRRYGTALVSLDGPKRLALVEAALAEDQLGTMPPIAEARHVAVGLLAYFCETPAATDLSWCRSTSSRPRPGSCRLDRAPS